MGNETGASDLNGLLPLLQRLDSSFAIFEADQAIDHFLYIAQDDLFTLPGTKTITINIQSLRAGWLLELLEWSYWNGTDWKPPLTPGKINPSDNSQIIFENLLIPIKKMVDEQEAAWLRARLQLPLSSELDRQLSESEITQITAGITSSQTEIPQQCFLNTLPIDLSKDFYPFGEQPRFNDTFYVALDPIVAKASTQVTIAITLRNSSSDGSNSLGVVWEVWDGRTWTVLSDVSKKPIVFSFAQNGSFVFTIPTIVPSTVNDGVKYWIRARISSTPPSQSPIVVTQLTAAVEEKARRLPVKDCRGFLAGDSVQIFSDSNTYTIESVTVDEGQKTLILREAVKQSYPQGTGVMLKLGNSVFVPPLVQEVRITYTYNANNVPLSGCKTQTPDEFLPWLANWVALSLQDNWETETKRQFIQGMVARYKRRGTKAGLEEILQLYLRSAGFETAATSVKVDDQFDRPHYFQVQLKLPHPDIDLYWKQASIATAIIDQEKPAHTYYRLQILVPTMQIRGKIFPVQLATAGGTLSAHIEELTINPVSEQIRQPGTTPGLLALKLRGGTNQQDLYEQKISATETDLHVSILVQTNLNWQVTIANLSSNVVKGTIVITYLNQIIAQERFEFFPGLRLPKREQDSQTIVKESGNTILGTTEGTLGATEETA